MNSTPKLLLHCCCAPCASCCVERLLDAGRQVTLFFSNSNIDTQAEFDKRLAEVIKLSKIFKVPLLVDDYDHAAWLAEIKGCEKEPEHGRRCNLCFHFSLSRASAKAAELGMNFCTSLTVSPYKNSNVLYNEGAIFDNFEFYNFKKQNGYVRSMELSREYNLYRQCYCGCEFSKAEALAKNAQTSGR